MPSFPSLNLLPSLPPYRGPYQVGTQDYEIPVSELSHDSPATPEPTISTVSFRLFYPCDSNGPESNPAHWLPSPQGTYLRAYLRFVGFGSWLAGALSYFPLCRLIFRTTLPALTDKPLLKPSSVKPDVKHPTSRWPVLVFSHGLGGSRNAYSHLCGSLASYGMVVAAVEHRDGSAPVTVIRKTSQIPARTVEYKRVGNSGVEKTADGQRDIMFKVRCWELALIHRALLGLDAGDNLTNLAGSSISVASMLQLHEPGSIAWAGHSFGASSIVQFLKSIHYSDTTLMASIPSTLKAQITATSPSIFLDLWALPVTSPATAGLLSRSLPCYDTASHSDGATAPLVVCSSNFFNWKPNLKATLRLLSPSYPDSWPTHPFLFYRLHSAHLSQSDFGVLFPRITKKALKAEEPEQTLTLNVRAILESLRRSGTVLADTPLEASSDDKEHKGQDWEILDDDKGLLEGWVAVPINNEADLQAAVEQPPI